ncbi:unnamed protein product [Orchesella dallaii]|uniref:Uncharacterized protein n=1 Tax=Orchesella dallaii TaxID=48710 RepID=A0ABP1QVN0_9HEXA
MQEETKMLDDALLEQHLVDLDFKEQARLKRETTSRKNALVVREETISSVAHSITAHVLQLPDHYASMRQIREAKNARRSVDKYFVRTIRKARENKAIAITEIQLRQRRQAENLAKLKNEIRDIKKNLITKNNMKRLHDEEIALEKEEVKKLLLSQGANPYIAEYLLAIEEKQREIQRKMLVEEQKRLLDMQSEYAIIEAAKAKEESERKKWNDYWSNKVKEKVRRERNSKMELYYDVQTSEEETRGDKELSQEKRQSVHRPQLPENENNKVHEADEETTEQNIHRESTKSSSRKKVASLGGESLGGRDSSKKTQLSHESKLHVGQNNRLSSERQVMYLDYQKKQSLLNSERVNFGDMR